MGIKLATTKYLVAERTYQALYKLLEYHKPAGMGLADWRRHSKYKKMLRELGEPVLRSKAHNKKLMEAFSKEAP